MNTHKGLIAWFTRNSVAANLLMLFIIVAGLLGTYNVRKESFPSLELNLISVQIPYLGAAPQEVEKGVVLRVEQAIEGLDGIKKITSVAAEGLASISVEVEENFDIQEVLNEVKMRIDAIPNLPENTENPNIYRVRARPQVLFVQVYGDMPERTMKELAKSVRDDIIALPGVSSADVWGDRAYEIAIEVSEDKLREYGLTFEQVSQAVRLSSIDLPGGTIKSENREILLRTKGQAYSGREFEEIVLLTQMDGTRLKVKDVAKVTDGFDESQRYAMFNGKDSVGIQVNSVGDQNVLHIAETVKQYVDTKRQELPPEASIDYWVDQSYYLNDRLDLMLNNMLQGAFLVFLILSFFLRIRLALWVLLGLPVCFLGTLMLMPTAMIDVSINMLSLFGFILVLGIVVDDAIIIGESVHAKIEKDGQSMDNVILGAQKVAMPATFGVLTTIAAFVPMLMVDGISSAIWKTIGWVVVLCLAFSLVESKWILPAHLAHMKPDDPNKKPNAIKRLRMRFNKAFDHFTHKIYQPFLAKCLNNRYTTFATFTAVFFVTIGLFGGGVVRFVAFPDIPSDFVSAQVQMIEGTPANQTMTALDAMEDALNKTGEDFEQETGEKVIKHRFMSLDSEAVGQMWVELSKGQNREIDAFEIARRWRENIPAIAGVKSMSVNGSISGGPGNDIAFQLTGKNLETLEMASRELRAALEQYVGIFDVEDSFSGGKQEITLEIKPEAEALGLRLSDLARQVRYGFYGDEAQRIQRGDEEVRVMVRYPIAERRSIAHLKSMYIRTPSGDEVPFETVADVYLGNGYSSITRIDGVRSITVSAKADKALIEPSKVTEDISNQVLPEILAHYPDVSYGLEGAAKEEAEAFISLGQGFLFSLLVIYGLMAIPLKSYSQPFIIMSVIPFGIVGAVVGHLILGLPMSMLSMFGIIALAGVVVNDSLIMVDFVNNARAQGMPLKEAAIQSGGQRIRAIVLTSLTTFFGLAPIIMETSLQAQIVIPMAVSLAFGIVFSTVITLFLVPCLYLILADIQGLFKSRKPQAMAQDLSS